MDDNIVGICIQQCFNDNDCPSIQKCCSNGCGNTCQDPAKIPDVCPKEKGECQDYQVKSIYLNQGAGDTQEEKEADCLKKCQAYSDATGCTFWLAEGNCEVYTTRLMPYESEYPNDAFCWILSKCTPGPTSEQPQCQQERNSILVQGRDISDLYIPSCKDDGTYAPKQCHESAGVCWCVDDYGNEITDSRKLEDQFKGCEEEMSINPCDYNPCGNTGAVCYQTKSGWSCGYDYASAGEAVKSGILFIVMAIFLISKYFK